MFIHHLLPAFVSTLRAKTVDKNQVFRQELSSCECTVEVTCLPAQPSSLSGSPQGVAALGAVSLRCNRTLIASITGSGPPRHHGSRQVSPGDYLLPRTVPEYATWPAREHRGVRERGALLPRRQLSAARAVSRGSSGHAWSAGFDWAVVVVVTGRRRHSGLTVPAAAGFPPRPCPPRAPAGSGRRPPPAWPPLR